MFQTYSFKLLQTGGAKGKALRNAMQLWTTTIAKFLELASERRDELVAIIEAPDSNKHLQKWVYDNLKLIPELMLMEPTLKHAVYNTLCAQLKSYFALQSGGFEPGFPTGRTLKEDDFSALLDEFTCDSHVATDENDFVTTAGLISGFGKRSEYLPLDFYYYKPAKGFFIAKSSRGNYFAGLYIEPGDSGFTPVSDDLVIVGTGEKVVARKKPCRLFPLAMNKWLQRKLETYKPATGRLVERSGEYFLNVTFELPKRYIIEPDKIIGVDLGKKRIIATAVVDFNGNCTEIASVDGLHVNKIKDITNKVAKAQAQGSHYRFRYGHVNDEIAHTTANKIVDLARKHNAVVAIEDLVGLRKANISESKSNFNHGRKSNTYGKSRDIILYKCKAAGIPVEEISPHFTSQTCPKCGSIDRNNRLVRDKNGKVTRFKFKCTSCEFEHNNSDEVAAINIARKYLYKKECIATKKRSKSAKNRSWQEFAQQMCTG